MTTETRSRVLVTGGAGFIGSHLAEGLLAAGNEVRVLDDLSSGKEENLARISGDVEFVLGDVRDGAAVDFCLEGVDAVFHLAGLASVPMSREDPGLCLSVNGRGTLNVLDSAAKHKVKRLVYASTSAVYGDLPAPHDDESPAPKPDTPYAAVKYLGENLALFYKQDRKLDTVVLRYFNVYGPRQSADGPDSGVIPLFMEAHLNGESPVVHGDGTQTRDFVHVGDVVSATMSAGFSKKASGVYNVSSGEPVSINRLLETFARLFPGNPLPPRFVPARPGDPPASLGTTARAERDLSFRASISLEEGLRDLKSDFERRRDPGPVARDR
ncbi:MAG: NAD-dependent epimerase/dehydratase family protein [Deltaproteobacteria bacterium]|nr:NAD-dependent epimerase/dehydratase family protein [Deltaproteobacteria bacterium]